jgi:5'-3' exonuclease
LVLIDYNQTFLSIVFSQPKNTPMDENLIRHIVLSALLSYKKKFSEEFGQLVLCSDGRNCWRKKLFPYYKAHRKKMRDSSGRDWRIIYESLNKIRDELKEYMPYAVLHFDDAEADDIIATLAKYSQTHLPHHFSLFNEPEPLLILSNDKDFIQLHKYENVKQYSPIQKKYITEKDPESYLKEKIIRGDPGDGIPNALSDADTFVNPAKRQTKCGDKTVSSYLNTEYFAWPKNIQENYNRNDQLINFHYIPQEICDKIVVDFEKQKPNRKKMMTYFIKNQLKNLMPSLQEF